MTSRAQALEPPCGVAGLIFIAFPLHPANTLAVTRADHLDDVAIPMLFLSGSRDALAEFDLIEQTMARLGQGASINVVADADHGFHVPVRVGRKDPQVLADALASASRWTLKVAATGRRRR